MIRIGMIRQDTRRRHPGRAWCEVAGRRFEATGPRAIYRMVTLLWLHGHGGADFEVWDDRSPSGKPGGPAMRGKVRNWTRLVKGKPVFDKDTSIEAEFSTQDRELIALAAGRVVDPAETASPRPDNSHTAASRPSDGPEYPQRQDCRTGNITLNIRDGKILGAHIEQIVTVRTRRPACRI